MKKAQKELDRTPHLGRIIDGAALEEVSYECFAAIRRNIDKVDPQ